MTDILEEITEGWTEFTGPNFNFNGYCCAKYRASTSKFKLEDVEVPARLEVLNEDGEWQQHPVVFIHYGSHEAIKTGRGHLVIFLLNGEYTFHPCNILDKDLYKKAERMGLTKGSIAFVKPIAREGE